MKNKTRKGQVAIIVMLLMIVILAIGLSLVSNTITDLNISSGEEEGLRAFSAAEAGIEEALRDIGAYVGTTSNVGIGTDYEATVTVSTIGECFEITIDQDKSVSVMVEGTDASILYIYWNGTGSVEAVVYEVNSLLRSPFNPSLGGTAYGFAEAGAWGSPPVSGNAGFSCDIDTNYTSRAVVNIGASPHANKIVRVKALFSSADMVITSNYINEPMPTQAYDISSTADVLDNTGKFEVIRSVPVLPPIFDFVLFNDGGSLST
jgi:hypothetical protein